MIHVALLAHGCRPNAASESRTGWQWVEGLSSLPDVRLTVFTDDANRHAIEDRDPAEAVGVDFVYARGVGSRTNRLPNHLNVTSEYTAFCRAVRPLIQERHRADPFDVGQHVSYVNIRLGTPLDAVNDMPIIFGPVSGGQLMPWSAGRFVGRDGATEYLRNIHVLWTRWQPSSRALAKRVDTVIVGNLETKRLAQQLGYKRVVEMADLAVVDKSRRAAEGVPEQLNRPLRVLWISRLIPRKALRLALETFTHASDAVPMTMTIAGDGPERRLEETAPRGVTFVGNVPIDELSTLYDDHDVLLFTSMRDSGCNPGLEALGRGKPMVCIDHQGAGFLADRSWAAPVAYSPKRTLPTRLAQPLVQMVEEEGLLRRLSEGAANSERHGTVNERAGRMRSIFSAAIQRTTASV